MAPLPEAQLNTRDFFVDMVIVPDVAWLLRGREGLYLSRLGGKKLSTGGHRKFVREMQRERKMTHIALGRNAAMFQCLSHPYQATESEAPGCRDTSRECSHAAVRANGAMHLL